MSTKSRESIYGSSVRASAERATEARKVADKLACVAWNQRMLGFRGPAQPSPTLGDALNAGYLYLEVKCLGCDTHQTVALNIVRRPKTTPRPPGLARAELLCLASRTPFAKNQSNYANSILPFRINGL